MDTLRQLPLESPVREYLAWIDSCRDDQLFQDKYQKIVEQQSPWNSCFLSVIIRTQGQRLEMLQDVLLCLAAQKNADFEVIVICHRAEKERIELVRQLIERQATSLSQKIILTTMNEGERGAPINLGFAIASGEYAVCLDDDDLVFDQWVDVFQKAAQKHPRMILRSYALTQRWESRRDNKGRQRLSAAGAPGIQYCTKYHTLHEQRENACPLMGMAFPLYLFKDLHILVREDLTTTEDWDFILRTAAIAGVYDTEETTAIYRLWDTQDTSRNMIKEEEWKQNYQRILAQNQNCPLLLPQNEVSRYRNELNGMSSSGEKGRSCFFREAVMFWSEGEPFSDARYVIAKVDARENQIQAEFELEKASMIQKIRIDPAQETLFALRNMEVMLYQQDQFVARLDMDQVEDTNGIMEEGTTLFLSEHPMITFAADENKPVDRIVFSAIVEYHGLPFLTKWAQALSADARWMAENKKKAHLYVDTGDGYSLKESLEYEPSYRGEVLDIIFDLSPWEAKTIKSIRVDPTEKGMILLDHFEMMIVDDTGKKETLHAAQIRIINGFTTQEGIVFLDRDPWVEIPVNKKMNSLRMKADIHFISVQKAEELLAEAVSVPNYEIAFRQLDHYRKNRWREENGDENVE